MKTPRTALLAACAFPVISLFSGCAYLNTYYNASVSYNAAREEHEKLLGAPHDTTPALPARVIAGYDTAISKSLKALQVYPRDIKWHDDAVYLIARSLFYKGEYQRAQRRLKQILEEYPASPFVPDAYLYLGKAYLADDNLAKAEETFSLVLAKYPHLNRNQQVSILLAELATRREGKALAIELLEKAMGSAKDITRKMELCIQIAGLYADLKRFDRAAALLESAPRKKNQPELLYRIDYLLSTCHIERRQYDRGLKLVEEMARNKTYFRHIPELLLRKANILDITGKTDDAVVAYEQILSRYSTGQQAGEAWFSLGVIHQKKKGDYAKAEECYEKAAQLLRDPDLKQIATQRRDALVLIRKLRNPGADSLSTEKKDTAVTFDRYRVGEILWLRLDEPDSALVFFAAVAADSATPPDSAAKALYAAAWIDYVARKDSAAADSILRILQERHSQTAFARQAQELLGRTVTVRTREDSAREALSSAEAKLFDESDPAVAIEAYLGVYRAFTDQEQGRRALYAAAWLNDFVLEKNKTAYTLYQELCDSFPKSEFCVRGAEPRLKIVKDTLRVRKASRPPPASAEKAKPLLTPQDGRQVRSAAPPVADSLAGSGHPDHDSLEEMPQKDPAVPGGAAQEGDSSAVAPSPAGSSPSANPDSSPALDSVDTGSRQ